MSACPRHPDAVLYTPHVRRAGRPLFSIPIGFCFLCFEEGGIEIAIYLSRPMLAAAFVDTGVRR